MLKKRTSITRASIRHIKTKTGGIKTVNVKPHANKINRKPKIKKK